MNLLVLGLVLFFAVHSVSIVNDGARNQLAARLGEWTWKGLYALIAVAGLTLIVVGYGLARHGSIDLYVPPQWLRHVALLLMLPVFPLLLAAYLPGRIQSATVHPMLAAIKLWAFAHLLANGRLVDVLLFGSFLVWAVVDRISMKHREQRPIPGAPPSRRNDIISVVGGLALYVAFVLGLHRWLIGVSPIG